MDVPIYTYLHTHENQKTIIQWTSPFMLLFIFRHPILVPYYNNGAKSLPTLSMRPNACVGRGCRAEECILKSSIQESICPIAAES